ncbi:MAG: UDP-N-acetylmuramate--L-alanine ligase [bacterium]|nr:UDP-N-acetylmuramate--L-alanine ligase [bacterium]MDZ4284898.1 UDP-N-acetylmuramate--L-alanine ligase [Patescibacteria group bacterium]
MERETLENVGRIHFVGVGGIGVSALARLMRSRGARVGGSDALDSELLDALRREGIAVAVGHDRGNVPEDTELLVYSSAVPEDNQELARAHELGALVLSRGAFLGLLSRGYYTIAVSGTHGKTTTTAMLAKVLADAGLKPTVLVGSLLAESGTNFLPGGEVETPQGPRRYLVVEACEYRRAFLALAPSMVVITNIEEDHLDYFRDIADIERAFLELVKKLPRGGVCIATNDVKHRMSNILSGGENVQHSVLNTDDAQCIDYNKVSSAGLRLRSPGRHNIENAQAVLAAAEALGVPRASAVVSLNDFRGTWRRFEYKGRIDGNGARVYDDYAHHPSEIRATLQGARELFSGEKIIAVFQPHLFSRTRQLLKGFAQSFGDADEVFIADIYAAREQDDGSVHSRDLVAAVEKHHPRVRYGGTLAHITDILKKETAPEDVVVLMGAGDVGEVVAMCNSRL